MLSPALFALLLPIPGPADSAVYNGRAGEVAVTPPRIEADVSIDGVLGEPVWQRAAILTGFSQFQPTDQRPSTDSTEVLVWYSPTAMHFGVRAFAPPGATNSSLSDRDKIQADDFIEIILDTFHDGRQAFSFGVNAVGVQADGTINENSSANTNAGGRTVADLSANFVYDSKGRVTDYGYEVEIRIPFKSIRYQSRDVQEWGVQIVRQVQHLGHEDTWTPVRRDASSFLAQSGTLRGLRDLRRGVVVDVNPSVVGFQTGAAKSDSSWGYKPGGPEYGATLRWGITNNLTLNGTVNPDFSQIEADVVAVQYDPRQTPSYPERRPFFLEGIENFAVGNNLIYTRSIVKPDAAVKLTGKALGTNVALLSAVDDRTLSFDGEGHPLFNIVRAVRDVGRQSRIGLAYTDRIDGGNYNRVLGLDARLLTHKLWTLSFQGAASRTRAGGTTTSAPLWLASVSRTGRRYTLNARINAIDPDFTAQSGLITRRGIADMLVVNTWSFFGRRGSLIESWNVGLRGQETALYDVFVRGGASQDRKLHFIGGASLRGGWRASGGVYFETFGYDPAIYADYYMERNLGATTDTVKFTAAGDPRLHNVDLTLSVSTPLWSKFFADAFYIGGKDENFEEWQSGLIHIFTLNAHWRPTDQLRIDGQYQQQEYDRWLGHSTVAIRKVPRLKIEYQATRAIFARMVGQYDTQEKGERRDDGRTNFPLLLRKSDGSFVRLASFKRNSLRADWLFSYQPTPGTVFFLGYGSSMSEAQPMRFRDLERTADGFFVKWSYLYRL